MWPERWRRMCGRTARVTSSSAEDVDVELRARGRVVQLLDRPLQAVAGVVDEDVDASEGGQRRVDRPVHGGRVGDVREQRQGAVGLQRVERLELIRAAQRARHVVAAFQGGLGQRPAEAAGYAGDEPGPLRGHGPGSSPTGRRRARSMRRSARR